jgi:hypothetical protein
VIILGILAQLCIKIGRLRMVFPIELDKADEVRRCIRGLV